MRYRWDIFCKVIDNFGDAGVCWRLARQLAADFDQDVRLWIDDLDTLSSFTPGLDCKRVIQKVQGVEICSWQQMQVGIICADVVIEAFACGLPDLYISAMLRHKQSLLWINLEYLSAEPWVVEYHLLPSPHPRLPLTKFFFFPGFVNGTGGLLREQALMKLRNEFDDTLQKSFVKRIGLDDKKPGCLWVSLFCYADAPVEQLLRILAESAEPILLIVPEGKVADRIVTILRDAPVIGTRLIASKHLSVRIIPFLEQTEYDRLLWCCDINFVRGEDSFVRAQWAMKSFIWNIYPQQEQVHFRKLDAFLQLYTTRMPTPMAAAVREMWNCWNSRYPFNAGTWMNFLAFRESLMLHNESWVNQLMAQEDLATNLVQFVENQL